MAARMRVLDFGTVSALRRQAIVHGLAFGLKAGVALNATAPTGAARAAIADLGLDLPGVEPSDFPPPFLPPSIPADHRRSIAPEARCFLE
jgi:hypothetical protein